MKYICLFPIVIAMVWMLSPKSEISKEEYSELPSEVFQYLGRHCKYPTSAIQKGIQGEVVLQMFLGGEGDLKALKVVKSIDPLLETEALQIIQKMPKWKTGKEGITQYIIPITFNLQ